MNKENSYKHIFKYTGIFASVQFFGILINIIRNKVIAVLLGPSGVGFISIYNTASTFLQNATNFGLQMSGVREISQAFDSGNESDLQYYIKLLRSWSLLAALLGAVLCLALSNFLSNWAFSSDEHTIHFALLSIVVGLATLTGGETAILKATRRLKNLATTSLLGVIAALVISVPLYVTWGYEGIIPSLILIGLSQMILVIIYSYRYYPPKVSVKCRFLRDGRSMITVGVAFVLAGVFGSGAEFFIRSYFSEISVQLAGLYNAGYMITMTYAGMVFAAMETDYYPHLSAVCQDTDKMNGAANRQIEVSLIMVSPLLVALMIGLPIIIPLLFSNKFIPLITMTQIAVVAMYFRAINLPVSYIMLAKGDSKSYLLLEGVYDVLIVFTIIFGYENWGLTGTGIGLLASSAIDALCVISYCAWKYDFALSDSLLTKTFVHISFGVVALALVLTTTGIIYWGVGVMIIAASACYSYHTFKHKVYA